MLGRATITLDIGPHSSLILKIILVLVTFQINQMIIICITVR